MATGIPELDTLVRAASKKFGKDMGGHCYGSPTPIPTGSLFLDHALRIGGLPRGRITEIFGWESSGKTSLALSIIAQAQKLRAANKTEGKVDLLLDVEHTMTEDLITGIGVDLSQVLWKRADSAEEALHLAINYPKSGAIDCVLFDSVDAAQNLRQIARDVGDDDVGGISKDMSFACRQLTKIASKTNTTYLFINQIREKPVQYGGKTTPGGNALKFYASVRLELLTGRPSTVIPNALMMSAIVRKTKVARPWGKDHVEIHFEYAKGPNQSWDVFALAKLLGLVRHSGSAVQTREGEGYVTIFKGTTKDFLEHLDQNTTLRDELKAKCLGQFV